MDAIRSEGEDLPLSADVRDFVRPPPGMRWGCIGCGRCCGNVFSRTWLDVSLREYIGEPIEGYCSALDRSTMRCGNYEGRPSICRGYPFILKKEKGRYEVLVHRLCRGIGKGPIVDLYEKAVELVALVEEEFDISFIVRRTRGGSGVVLYRIK